ncbi:unnamed protein product, partial [Phaeothamnion confervicola]
TPSPTRTPTKTPGATTSSPTRTPTSSPVSVSKPLISVSFTGNPSGTKYTESMAKNDFNLSATYLAGLNEGRGVLASDAGNPYLRVIYPQGCVGPKECGVQLKFPLGATFSELWVSFRVRFETGFMWIKGGKLPGLCGGTCPTGCVAVDGLDGFSARHMWRADGKAVGYTYEPLKTESCGEDYPFGTFVAGRWHKVTTRVRMNFGGEHAANGVLQTFLDGAEVLRNETMLWRNSDSAFGINTFYFSTFFGGSDNSWAPTKISYIDFDDIVVSKTPLS